MRQPAAPLPPAAREARALADGFRLSQVRALVGPNPWRSAPAAVGELHPGPLLDGGRDVRPAWTTLLPARPALDPEHASRADVGAEWARAVAQLAVELQRLAGSDVAWWRVAPSGDQDTWIVAVDYEEERVGTGSLREAAALLRDAIAGEAPDLERAVDHLRERWRRDRPGPIATVLLAEARRRGIPVRRVPGDPVVQLGLGCRLRRIDATLTTGTSVIAADITRDRDRAKRLLARLGIPVPRGDVARDVEEAIEIAGDIGYPVLVKPRDADGGRGASARLDDEARLRAAFPLARAGDREVVVERYVEGRDHRVLVVDGRVVAVTGRAPSGAATIDRTDEIHPDNAVVCAFAADAVGLDVAGIDVRTPDIGVPFAANGGALIELHASPGIRLHTEPDEGRPRDVPGAILDMLFPPGAPTRVPVLAVTGTNGKTTTTRLLAHLFRHAGERVGFTTTDGVYWQDRVLYEGDMTGPMGADMVLTNPRVDLAVLEVARGGLLRAGLGVDRLDVAVVLNVTSDHLGMRGIHTIGQLADVKRALIGAVPRDGHVVLNADDPLVLAMREAAAGAVVLFSTGPAAASPALAAHLAAGGAALTVEGDGRDEAYVLHRGSERLTLIRVADIPLTMGGAARFAVQNAAAATAAAWSAGLPPERLRAGLAAFMPSAATTPGRMNHVQVRGATVVVDYAHNEAAIAALMDYAARADADRRIAVLSTPGDRRDEDIRAIGALGARVDVAILKEHPHYRRGRAPGEIVRLMREGLLAAGGDAARALAANDEQEALDAVFRLLRPRDLVLFIADEATMVLRALADFAREPT